MSEHLSSIVSSDLTKMLRKALKYLLIAGGLVLLINSISTLWEPLSKTLIVNGGLLLAFFSGWICYQLINHDKPKEASRLLIITGFSMGIFTTWITSDKFLFAGPFIVILITLIGLFAFTKRESLIWSICGQCISSCSILFLHPLNPVVQTGYSFRELMHIGVYLQFISCSAIILGYYLVNDIKRVMVGTHFKTLKLKRQALRQNQLIEEIRISESRVQEIFNLIPDMIFLTDLNGNLITANTAVLNHMNCSLTEALRLNIHDSFVVKNPDPLKKSCEKIKTGELVRDLEIKVRIKKRIFRYFELNGDPVYENGEIRQMLFLARDITGRTKLEKRIIKRSVELVAANEKLMVISSTDSLTGLNNRLKLENELDQEFLRAERYQDTFSVILIDVDHFKKVNDTYGHPVGDTVLKTISGILQKTIRRTDIAGRWGGEEFLILCTGTDRNSAFILAENLRELVQAHQIEGVFPVTISLGVAEYREGDEVMDIVSRADQGLYFAKNNGRNQSCIYEPVLSSLKRFDHSATSI